MVCHAMIAMIVWLAGANTWADVANVSLPAGGTMTALLILFAAICVLAVLAQRAMESE